MMLHDPSQYHRHIRGVSDIRPSGSAKPAEWPPRPLQEERDVFVSAEEQAKPEMTFQGHDSRWHESVLHAYPKEESFSEKRIVSPARRAGVILLMIACASLLGVAAVSKGLAIRDAVMEQGERGFGDLLAAAESMKGEQYGVSAERFGSAYQSFSQAESDLTLLGRTFAEVSGFIPFLSQASSGKHAIEAGKHFALAGMQMSRAATDISLSKKAQTPGAPVSLLGLLERVKAPLDAAVGELESAEQELASIDANDIPEDKRERFIMVKRDLPMLIGLFKTFRERETLVNELLGGNGPRKYLFLLQNNHEARATGGFIGTYALLDVQGGVVKRFFVDGIFNPDGQLKENIVPPKPIQKISAGWSLHDSNWFPDFPASAEKAIFFYEKTGGPTVDGVIALTPTVMKKLLAVTGPIDLPEYALSVDADNFMPVIQEQVEVKYDKEENKPKQVLADLSMELLERVFASQDKETILAVGQALTEGLNEKHILLYTRHPETEALIDTAGWSGRVLDAKKDYLSVIHTNINGYKTDGVINETIRHRAEIQEDGSVIDTVTITREHTGGDTPYEWWNKVNTDYLRVYVPLGSELLSAKGATWEFPPAPLDYDALGFRKDADVEREEKRMIVDERTGTRISEDAGKTVFGAWVYVSPKESVTVEYRYRLPFRVDFSSVAAADSYAATYQKQSGSEGSRLFSSVAFPAGVEPVWQTGPNLVRYGRELRSESDLRTDRFIGAVFRKNH
jgi:hypothetical protein